MLQQARQQGYSDEEFFAGIPYSRKHLETASEWFSWESYLTLLERLQRGLKTDEQWVDFGKQTIGTPKLQRLISVLTLLVDPRVMAKWVFKFGGFRIFKTMDSAVDEEGTTLSLQLTARAGFQGNKFFFLTCQGALSAFP